MITSILHLTAFTHWLAQTSGGSGGSSPDITNVLTLVTQIGLSGVFLWQWRDERKERRDLQEKMVAWIEKFGPVLESSTVTLAKVQAVMTDQVDQSKLKSDRNLEKAADHLNETAQGIQDLLRHLPGGDLT